MNYRKIILISGALALSVAAQIVPNPGPGGGGTTTINATNIYSFDTDQFTVSAVTNVAVKANAVISGLNMSTGTAAFGSDASITAATGAIDGETLDIGTAGFTVDATGAADATSLALDTALPITEGGTGSTVASAALTALGGWTTDDELAALGGLVSAADRLPYFTGSATASLATFTAFARTILDDADAGTVQATLSLVPGTNVQTQDALLQNIADLTTADRKILGFSAADTPELITTSDYMMDTFLALGTPAGILSAISAAASTYEAFFIDSAGTSGQVWTSDGVTRGGWASPAGITEGILDGNHPTLDGDAADNEYAKFTPNGLEGQTYAQVRSDLNVEDGAAADMTGAEIKLAYEGEADTNAYTDAEKAKLAGVEAGADVTDASNVNAAGAVMNTDYAADSLLIADTVYTPEVLTVAEQRLVGRLAGDTKIAAQVIGVADNNILQVDGSSGNPSVDQWAVWTADGLKGVAAPAGAGDMTKAVYDPDSDNRIASTNIYQDLRLNTLILTNLTAGRVALAGGSGQVIDDAELTYNTTTDLLTVDGDVDVTGTLEGATITEGGVGVPNVNDNLSVFAATTSTQLRGVLSDETGTGNSVFSASPTFTGEIEAATLDLTGALKVDNAAAANQLLTWSDATTSVLVDYHINIMTYGATPDDNSDDDALAIEAAITAGGAGSVIYIPPGVFDLKTAVDITTDNITIIGAGMEVSILDQNTSDQHAIYFNAVSGGGVQNLTVRDVVDTSGPSGPEEAGIYSGGNADTASDSLHYRNVRVENCAEGIKINVDDGTAADNPNDCSVIGCVIDTTTGGAGIEISGLNHVVVGNVIKDADDHGIRFVGRAFENSQFLLAAGNTIEGVGLDGVYVGAYISDVTITGNTIDGNGQGADSGSIMIQAGTTNIVVANNVCQGPGANDNRYGVLFNMTVDDLDWRNIRVHHNSFTGYARSMNVKVDGAVSSYGGFDGLFITDNSMSDWYSTGTDSYGIFLSNANVTFDDVFIERNYFYEDSANLVHYAIYVSGTSGDVHLTDNRLNLDPHDATTVPGYAFVNMDVFWNTVVHVDLDPGLMATTGASTLYAPGAWMSVNTIGLDPNTDEYAYYNLKMPDEWDTASALKLRLYATTDAANGGGNTDVMWEVDAGCRSDGNNLNADFTGTADTETQTLSATADILEESAVFTVVAGGTPVPGDFLVIRIMRDADGGADNCANDVLIVRATLEYAITENRVQSW